MRSLTELLRATRCHVEVDPRFASLQFQGITGDSRQVEHGSLFVAVRGKEANGEAYIDAALAQGAAAIITAMDCAQPPTRPTCWIKTDNPRLLWAEWAAALYAPQPACVVAITGTDGKTSTADFTRQLFELFGKPAMAVGTLGITGTHKELTRSGNHTTPDATTLHRTLRGLARANIQHVAMEASSHGLDQYRLHGVVLKAAAFTNITRDHLDYHETEARYFAAKAKLFSEVLPEGAPAVIYADDAKFAALSAMCAARHQPVIGYGEAGNRLRIVARRAVPHGQEVELRVDDVPLALHFPLIGYFQLLNALAASGLVAAALDLPLMEVVQRIPQLQGVPGRLQLAARHPAGGAVYVDYAHTPGALKQLLTTVRPHVAGKLHLVFGCGGDRDPGKRPEMGAIAAQLADHVVVTDDNPRSEAPDAIRRAVLATCPQAREMGDRGEAIAAAVTAMQAGDVLLIAGKGHEKTQTIGKTIVPFDDVEVAQAAASQAVHGATPQTTLGGKS